jgi:hypothetical protein
MSQSFRSFMLTMYLCAVAILVASSSASAEDPPAPKPPAPQAKPMGPSCSMADADAPRGGRLDITGERLGQAPVVRIAGKPARILERREDRISVQVAADSNGGVVTVQADGKTATCGTLNIIGKNS